MARYRTVISSSWAPERAFAYMSDFTHAALWDPGVASSTMSTPAPVAFGSVFRVVTAHDRRPFIFNYHVTEFSPPHRVVLHADAGNIISHDTISVVERSDGGADIFYDARLTFRGWWRCAHLVAWWTFPRLARRGEAGLIREVNA